MKFGVDVGGIRMLVMRGGITTIGRIQSIRWMPWPAWGGCPT